MANQIVDEIIGSLRYEPKRCKCRKKLDIKVSESKDNPRRIYYRCNDCDTFDWAIPVIPDDLRWRLNGFGDGAADTMLLKKMDDIAWGVKLIGWCMCFIIVIWFFKM